MRGIDWFRAVLTVRRQREETAERALAATLKEMMRCRTYIEQCRAALAEINALRVGEIQRVSPAEQYQCIEARYRTSRQQCIEWENKLSSLEPLRAEQMSAYTAARCAREAVEEVAEQRRMTHDAELKLRELKWHEDMFLARRVSNSNRS